MPKTTNYDWTTDPIVVGRLEKSPGFPFPFSSPNHIEKAWMLELAKDARKHNIQFVVTPYEYEKGRMCIDFGHWNSTGDKFTAEGRGFVGPAIRALALALNWLETQT